MTDLVVNRNKEVAELRLALEVRGYRIAEQQEATLGLGGLLRQKWASPTQGLWLEQVIDLHGFVTAFTLYRPATASARVADVIAAIDPAVDWSDPPRRGADWEIFDNAGALEIERNDDPDHCDYPRFPSDDEAASFVLMTACWNDCPRTDVRNECRDALREIVYQEGWDDEDLEWLLLQRALQPSPAADGLRLLYDFLESEQGSGTLKSILSGSLSMKDTCDLAGRYGLGRAYVTLLWRIGLRASKEVDE